MRGITTLVIMTTMREYETEGTVMVTHRDKPEYNAAYLRFEPRLEFCTRIKTALQRKQSILDLVSHTLLG